MPWQGLKKKRSSPSSGSSVADSSELDEDEDPSSDPKKTPSSSESSTSSGIGSSPTWTLPVSRFRPAESHSKNLELFKLINGIYVEKSEIIPCQIQSKIQEVKSDEDTCSWLQSGFRKAIAEEAVSAQFYILFDRCYKQVYWGIYYIFSLANTDM